jgi:hypothetical protein
MQLYVIHPLQSSSHTQASDFIPQPENRPMEAQAVCQPQPHICNVSPCHEQPQVSAESADKLQFRWLDISLGHVKVQDTLCEEWQ